MSVPKETRDRLRRWGKWAGGGVPGGYPRKAAFAQERIQRSLVMDAVDRDILRVDELVKRADFDDRQVLIRHYCSDGTPLEKAMRSGLTKRIYFAKLEDAQWFIHFQWNQNAESEATYAGAGTTGSLAPA